MTYAIVKAIAWAKHLIEIGEREPATVDLNMLRRPM